MFHVISTRFSLGNFDHEMVGLVRFIAQVSMFFLTDIGGAKGGHHEKPAQWRAEWITLFVGVVSIYFSAYVLLYQGGTVLLVFESPAHWRNCLGHRMEPFNLIPLPSYWTTPPRNHGLAGIFQRVCPYLWRISGSSASIVQRCFSHTPSINRPVGAHVQTIENQSLVVVWIPWNMFVSVLGDHQRSYDLLFLNEIWWFLWVAAVTVFDVGKLSQFSQIDCIIVCKCSSFISPYNYHKIII